MLLRRPRLDIDITVPERKGLPHRLDPEFYDALQDAGRLPESERPPQEVTRANNKRAR